MLPMFRKGHHHHPEPSTPTPPAPTTSMNRRRATSNVSTVSSSSVNLPPSVHSRSQTSFHANAASTSRLSLPLDQGAAAGRDDEYNGLQVNVSDASLSALTARRDSSSTTGHRRSSSNIPSPRSGMSLVHDDDDDGENSLKGSVSSRNKRLTPLERRLGEENPYFLPHPSKPNATSTTYPGVILGSFAAGSDSAGFGMQFDGSMDDILDPKAGMGERHGSTAGQAGANIAPWLQDDTPESSGPGPTTPIEEFSPQQDDSPQKHSSHLSHFPSIPTLPKMRRQGTTDSTMDKQRLLSRNGSQPSFQSDNQASDDGVTRMRLGSSESVQTLAAVKAAKTREMADEIQPLPALTGGGRHARQQPRHGSTASNISANSVGSERRKGFLPGFLKRKTGHSVSQAHHPDFNPTDAAYRASTSGSTSSRLSASTSFSSLHHQRPSEQRPDNTISRMPSGTGQSMFSESSSSPTHEISGAEFTLDMNFDDMEGIVDPSLAGTVPTHIGSSAPEAHPPGSSSGGVALADALDQTGSFMTSQSGSISSTGSGPSSAGASRRVVSPAERMSGDPFIRGNPFQSISPQGSFDVKRTPPSPHSLTLSPKNSLPASTQPRRPSQLRNVKMGSIDSDLSSDVPDSAHLQPLSPAWASGSATGLTLFNDPFGSTLAPSSKTSGGVSPSHVTQFPDRTQNISKLAAKSIPPTGPAAAWAAPESWGVEGDAEEEETSSSEDDYTREEGSPLAAEGGSPQASTSGASRKPPAFGFKSSPKTGSVGSQTRTTSKPKRGGHGKLPGGTSASARPSSSGRPGTSGSISPAASLPHYIRIYRGDGSYEVMSFPITATTSEIVNVLSGATDKAAGKKVATNMRLYLRANGQDRQLQPNEKPLVIQDRRLRQAGYTDAEHLEELGKSDLFILCKFMYQTPNLPVMNPEEESSYDSFEFIDVAGRDLLTIPIFLHLHAHNIIILNVSRNPMTDIPLDFVQACSSLKELRMSYMALKRIPTSICASTTLSRLDVSCNRIADLENVPLHEIHTLTSLKVQNNKLASIPSYFAQMKALKYLNISNNKFEQFPSVVSDMSNLVDLDVSFNNICELPSEMSNLKSLERLAAFGNDLITFPQSFSTLANLRALDVRRNKLTNLDSVYALPNLTILQADHNDLITLDAQIGAKVRQFSVPHNSITRFTLAPQLHAQAVTYSLTRLDLSHGKLSTLDDEAFSGLVNLKDINLSFNQFTRLPATLGNLVNLEQILCTDNLLEDLPVGLGHLQKLRIINVHNNNLKHLPVDLWACSAMEHLNLSSNMLATVPNPPPMSEVIELCGPEISAALGLDAPDASYPAALSMKTIQLADNRLTDEIFHYLAYSSSLRIINLSFNDLYEIPVGVLTNWVNLEQLYLSGNKLTTLPAEDLEKLQNLRVLHLNGNKLQTLPSELGALGNLQHLDVGSNVLKYNIANWPYDWNWNWNTALRYLNLSGNKRLEIKPTSAQDMSHASSFRKDLSDFTALSQLSVLGLMDVTLRIPSLPDESDEKRVRTSFSDINNMAYGISDMMGSAEHLSMFDLVVPNFRGKDNECLFGMFGRATTSGPAGKIPRFLQESFGTILTSQLERLGEDEAVTEALRRTFLFSNRATFQHLMSSANSGRKSSLTSVSSMDPLFRNWSPSPTSQFRQGASGAVVYLVEKTLHVGNVGDCIVILSRKGEAEVLSKRHDPTEREETARIRKAEAWVSTKGYVNDEKDVNISRAVGYFQHFPAINASPEIRTRELTDADEFVIIGNHALWKCCSYQTAVDIARTERDDPMMAAQKLRDFAISYGAEGSVMVMVVNISDLFYGRGQRRRGLPGSGGAAGEADTAYSRDKRAIRRRYEEVGDRTLSRLQQEIEPPTGQVAIVFTDIVNSTHLWETNPSMPTAIKMHHNLMRRQLRLDGGYEVKTEGDSFMVSFQTVPAALLWAFNCQIGLLQQEWPRELLEAPDGKIVYDSEGNLVQRGLRVRMGVHWGAPQCEKDPITRRMDYYGPMVNRAARINASADGGQLMASQDVINEIQALREYLDTLDEVGLSDMPPEMKREVAELKRIGFEVKDMGERKLKGLEVPERLHLLYPKSLAGRFETSNDIRPNVEVTEPRSLISESRQIEIDEVRDLAKIILRMEALCNIAPAPVLAIPPSSPTTPLSPSIGMGNSGMEMVPSWRAPHHTHSNGQMLNPHRSSKIPPPAYLGPHIKDDMGDEELLVVMDSLTTRLENAMSTLYIKNLGGFSSVLTALEQATRIDSRLIVHALSLMNGAIN